MSVEASLNVTMEKETDDQGFVIAFTVNEAVGMTPKIFVIERDTGKYNRVASVWDLTTDEVPDSPVDGIPWFRTHEFTKTFTFEERILADRFETEIPPMIDRLVESIRLGEFSGEDELEFPSS